MLPGAGAVASMLDFVRSSSLLRTLIPIADPPADSNTAPSLYEATLLANHGSATAIDPIFKSLAEESRPMKRLFASLCNGNAPAANGNDGASYTRTPANARAGLDSAQHMICDKLVEDDGKVSQISIRFCDRNLGD